MKNQSKIFRGLAAAVLVAATCLTAQAQSPAEPASQTTSPPAGIEYLDQATRAFEYLFNLNPVPFTILIIWCIGYVPRFITWVPNKVIPGVCMIAGALLMPVLLNQGEMELWAFIFRSTTSGFVLGTATWLIHDRWGDTIESKIPFLSKLLAREAAEEKQTPPPTKEP